MKQVCLVWVLLGVWVVSAQGAPVILNEYNAVGSNAYLKNNGTDTYWGRQAGNGGDWFELVVINDHLDMGRWEFVISWYDTDEHVRKGEVLKLTNHDIWSDLRTGTIITISENLADDISYNPIYDPHNPFAGDWWINVQASTGGTGAYIEKQDFHVNNNNWQLVIRDAGAHVFFGPAGEGVSPASGIGNDEVFRLEADPSALITPSSSHYDDGGMSTFGAANRWGGSVQDFSQLRSVVPEPTTLALLGTAGIWILTRKRRSV